LGYYLFNGKTNGFLWIWNVTLNTRRMPQLHAVFGMRRRLLTEWCI
jgi:hypothetical protein